MQMIYNFYDTSSLLLKASTLFEDPAEHIIISSITLKELEEIKTMYNKTSDIKFAARRLLAQLAENKDKYEVVIFTTSMLQPIIEKDLMISNDTKILSCAIWYDKYCHPDETIFITNDLSLSHIANLFFGNDSISMIEEDIDDEYIGYKIIKMTEEEMGDFYSHLDFNKYDLYINQYLILKNNDNEIVDKMKWSGETHIPISYGNIDSRYLGKIKPYKDDPYQALAIDSFLNNKITLIKGPAGTGKSYLSLGYLFHLLGNNKIDKIIIFCNTVATKGAARLGLANG